MGRTAISSERMANCSAFPVTLVHQRNRPLEKHSPDLSCGAMLGNVQRTQSYAPDHATTAPPKNKTPTKMAMTVVFQLQGGN
jgi:hypothetical protein